MCLAGRRQDAGAPSVSSVALDSDNDRVSNSVFRVEVRTEESEVRYYMMQQVMGEVASVTHLRWFSVRV